MSTKYKQLFDAANAEFDERDVKYRAGKKDGPKNLAYIKARTAMNRLDEVFGPENWSSAATVHGDVVISTITVRLTGGEVVTHQNLSGIDPPWPGFEDFSVRVETAMSDAFKRCAVMFGVARYLYKDGVPYLEDVDDPVGTPREATLPPSDAPSTPARPHFKTIGDELYALVHGDPSDPSMKKWIPLQTKAEPGEWSRRLASFCEGQNKKWKESHPEFRGDIAEFHALDMQARMAVAEAIGFSDSPTKLNMDPYAQSAGEIVRIVVKRLKSDYLGVPA